MPSLEQKSEAVITETEQSSGAIPKKRPPSRDIAATTELRYVDDSNLAGDATTADPYGSSKTWQRTAFRRRRTQDQISVEGIDECTDDNVRGAAGDESGPLSTDLRQKILDILAQDDHDQDLERLRTELVLRKQRVRRKIQQQMERHIEQSDPHMGAPSSTSEMATQASNAPGLSSASNAAATVPRRPAVEEEARRDRRRQRRAARRRGAEQQQQESAENDPRGSIRKSSSEATNPSAEGGGDGDRGVSSALATMFGQQGAGAHIAVDHSDTSEGAVHCFQDEFGNWHTYRFGSDSTGLATQVNTPALSSANENRFFSTLLQSGDTPALSSGGGKVHESRCSWLLLRLQLHA